MRGLKDSKWLLAFGAAIGLAIMAKSVIAVFAVVAAVFALLIYRRFDLFKNKYAYGSIAIALLVAAPWHLWEWAHFGNAFWLQYIGVEVLDRTQQNLFWTVSLTNDDYVRYLLQFTQPWVWLFIAALAATAAGWKGVAVPVRRFVVVCAGTVAMVVLVFFTSKTKAPTYLLPLYPFAAMSIALAAFSTVELLRTAWVRGVMCIGLLVTLCLGAYSTYYNAYHHNPYFSIELTMAQDEYRIGNYLAVVPQSTPVQVYDDVNLGSIEYYSRRLVLPVLTATSSAPTAGYVIVDTDSLQQFSATYPTAIPNIIYSGPQVSLIQVRS